MDIKCTKPYCKYCSIQSEGLNVDSNDQITTSRHRLLLSSKSRLSNNTTLRKLCFTVEAHCDAMWCAKLLFWTPQQLHEPLLVVPLSRVKKDIQNIA